MSKELIEKLILMYLQTPKDDASFEAADFGGSFIGKYVVCRTYAAGVHVGVLKSYNAVRRHALLTESRRIWSWGGAFTLSEVSQHGITEGKVAIPLNEIMITQIEEIIPCSEVSEKILRNVAAYKP